MSAIHPLRPIHRIGMLCRIGAALTLAVCLLPAFAAPAPSSTPAPSGPPAAPGQAGVPAAPAPPVAPATAQPPFTLRISGMDRSEAPFEEISRTLTCPLGSPDGRSRLVVTPSPGEDGRDWSMVEIETPPGGARCLVDRVYRLSGPCWAPDGSYFVYSTGGIVKAAASDRSAAVIWQDQAAEKGGIFPSEARNFSWGTAMGSLRFVVVEDPRRAEPRGTVVLLHIAR